MSLFGALSSGVSGLSAQSSAMGAIADNVTNVNTIGYKGTDVQFKTLVTKQVSSTKYSPGGVTSAPKQGVDQQGLLQATTNATDVAISGQGFFVVNEQANPENGGLFAYTRAGSFSVDKDGNLQNTSGWYLQGWPLLPAGSVTTGFSTVDVGNDTYIKGYKNEDGDTVSINDNIVTDSDLEPLNLNTIGGTAQETKNIRLGANLPSGDEVGTQHKTNVVVFDTLGNSSNLELVFEKDRENSWGTAMETPSGASVLAIHGSESTIDSTPDIFAASGLIEFTKVPADGETIEIDGITFEFDTDSTSSVTETATLRRVDISASTIVEAKNVTTPFITAINASNLSETSRFEGSGTDIKITQSAMGAAIALNVSGTLSVKQVAAQSRTGVFTVPEIDFAYKNGAKLDFDSTTLTDYNNMQTVLKTGSGAAITYTMHTPAQASASNTFAIQRGQIAASGNTMTVSSAVIAPAVATASAPYTLSGFDDGTAERITGAASTFTGISVGDTVTVSTSSLSGTNDSANRVVTATDGSTYIEFADSISTGVSGSDTTMTVTHLLNQSADTITSTTAAFTGWQVGDLVTIASSGSSGNDITTQAITAVTSTTISFADGTFDGINGADTSMVITNTTQNYDMITGSASTFIDFTTGSVTTSASVNTDNNVTASITATDNSTYLRFAAGTLGVVETAGTTMKVTKDDSTTIKYVDMGSATTVSEIVTALGTKIDATAQITTDTRFTADGTTLLLEQSAIGDLITLTMNNTTADGGTGTVSGTYKLNDVSTAAVDGVSFDVVQSDYGFKKAAIDFNGDGTPNAFNIDNVDIQWANGSTDQTFASTTDDRRIGLFLGDTDVPNGMTQFAGSYQINFINQNGAQFGNFAGVSIGEDGIVTALFDNGVTRPVFMIPVATFVNANQMNSLSGNVWIETDFSGMPTVREAGEGGAGSLTGAALESSTVDLGEEFTNMIVTQRAYSAAAKIITTADEMLDELLRVK